MSQILNAGAGRKMRGGGLEPPRVFSPLAPQTSASAISAILAHGRNTVRQSGPVYHRVVGLSSRSGDHSAGGCSPAGASPAGAGFAGGVAGASLGAGTAGACADGSRSSKFELGE